MSRVEGLISTTAVVALGLVLAASPAAAVTGAEGLRLTANDLSALASSLAQPSSPPLKASLTSALQPPGNSGIELQAFTSQARLTELQLRPIAALAGLGQGDRAVQLGAVAGLASVSAQVDDLVVEGKHCTLTLSVPKPLAATAAVDLWLDAGSAAQGGSGLTVQTTPFGPKLTGYDLEIATGANCELPAADLAPLRPWFAALLSEEVGKALATALTKQVRDVTEHSFGLETVWLLRDYGREQSMRGLVALTVDALAASDQGLSLDYKADVAWAQVTDPNSNNNNSTNYGNNLEVATHSVRPTPNQVRLASSLVQAIFERAAHEGLLRLSMPSGEHGFGGHLMAAQLADAVPDVRRRFAPTEPVAMTGGDARQVHASLRPCTPGGIPIIDLVLEHVPITLEVAAHPYLIVDADVAMTLTPRLSPTTLSLIATKAQITVEGARLEEGLDPAPADAGIDRARLTGIASHLLQGFDGQSLPLLTFDLPALGAKAHLAGVTGLAVDGTTLVLDLAGH